MRDLEQVQALIRGGMRPGRAVRRVFPSMSDKEVEHLVIVLTEEGNLHWAFTEDEMIEVYARGPHSCMKGRALPGLWARGGLALAWLADQDGRPVARTLVSRDRKAWVRLYGEGHHTKVLVALLRDQGYREDPVAAQMGVKVRFTRKEAREARDRYVTVPYTQGHWYTTTEWSCPPWGWRSFGTERDLLAAIRKEVGELPIWAERDPVAHLDALARHWRVEKVRMTRHGRLGLAVGKDREVFREVTLSRTEVSTGPWKLPYVDCRYAHTGADWFPVGGGSM